MRWIQHRHVSSKSTIDRRVGEIHRPFIAPANIGAHSPFQNKFFVCCAAPTICIFENIHPSQNPSLFSAILLSYSFTSTRTHEHSTSQPTETLDTFSVKSPLFVDSIFQSTSHTW